MTSVPSHRRRPGRPTTTNPATQRLPVVRVTPAKLDEYRNIATRMGVSISEWVRVNLDVGAGDDLEVFMKKRRESRINDIETGRYYQFKIPGNYKTLGYVLKTDGEYVEFQPYKQGIDEKAENPGTPKRVQRVNKDQIIDVIPASKQMLNASGESGLY